MNSAASASTGTKGESLFVWVKALPICKDHPPTTEDFQDGILLGKILKESIDKDYFKSLIITRNSPTPLIKVVERMKNYMVQQIGYKIPKKLDANVGKIQILGDFKQISNLLQILLSCAIGSPEKSEFIAGISKLDNNVQNDLMEAIKEMQTEPVDEEFRTPSPNPVVKTSQTMQENNKIQLAIVLQENKDLKLEKDNNLKIIEELEGKNISYKEKLKGTDEENKNLQKQILDFKKKFTGLEEDKFTVEEELEEYKRTAEKFEKSWKKSQMELAEMSLLKEMIKSQEDEMDILRYKNEELIQIERQVETLKKTLEKSEIFKREKLVLEEKYENLLQEKLTEEKKAKEGESWKIQLSEFKNILKENEKELSKKTLLAQRHEIENKEFQIKIKILQEENLALRKFKDAKEAEEESLDNLNRSIEQELTGDIKQELVSHKKKIEFLENLLEKKIDPEVLVEMADENKDVVEKLEIKIRDYEKDYIALKKTNEDRISLLQAQVASKKEEIRRLVFQLNDKENSSASSEKENKEVPSNTNQESKQKSKVQEEKLLSSAFYNLAIRLHKEAVTSRNLSLLDQYRVSILKKRKDRH